MFTKTLFLDIAAFSMVSFSNLKQTTQEATFGCPFNSTTVTASCTSGCYSFSLGGVMFPLTGSMLDDAQSRLQGWCDNQSLLCTIFESPTFL